jgi:hypothetical protein
MADIRLLFPHEYLQAADLRGKDVPLTVSRVTVDDLRTDKGTEKKPVVYFAELDAKKKKGETCPFKFVLNRTNAKTIAKALGSHETDAWVGRRIVLYPTTCLAFGSTVDCIRVREKEAPARNGARRAAPDPMPEPEPEIPADEEHPFNDEEAL